MSDNSGNGRFGVPVLTGYAVEWDDDAQTWVATNDHGTELRGRDQSELNAARGRLVDRLSREILEITHYAARNGYTPPPS